jgi:hypothetical protein
MSAGTAAAADLNTIDEKTTVAVDASAVTTITGLVADVKTAIAASGINTPGNYAATLEDSSVSVADANIVDADTSGIITATLITGGISSFDTLTGTGNVYAITVNDAATIAQLTALDAKTTGALTYGVVSDTVVNLVADTGNYVSTGSHAVTVTDVSPLTAAI